MELKKENKNGEKNIKKRLKAQKRKKGKENIFKEATSVLLRSSYKYISSLSSHFQILLHESLFPNHFHSTTPKIVHSSG